ncbi:MAG: S8 family serine peptidase [Chloroflexota bacterium]
MVTRSFPSVSKRAVTVIMTIVIALALSLTLVSADGDDNFSDLEDLVGPELIELALQYGGIAVTDIPGGVDLSAFSPTVNSNSVSSVAANAVPGTADALQSFAVTTGDYVLIDALATGSGEALLAELEAMGLQAGASYLNRVSGYLPVSAITSMENVASLSYMTASRAERHVGLVTNEAVFGQAADVAVSRYGTTGEGLAIGVLSDSFDCQEPTVVGGAPGPDLNNDGISSYADDILSGDLPAGIIVLEEIFQGDGPTGCIDEGRAMAQLIHDIIPDAQIIFHTAFNGEASFAEGIIELAEAGADVIVDDVRYFAEPVFQDGIIAQAVDTVTAMGVPYFSSAGNAADQGYLAPFNDSGEIFETEDETYLLHDFDFGPDVDITNEVSVAPGGSSVYVLQWSDPFATVSTSGAGPDSDFDLLLFSPDLSVFFGAFNPGSDIGDIPFDAFSVGGPFEFVIMIGLKQGTSPFAILATYSSSSSLSQEYDGGPTSWGHANSRGANATGAAFWGTTPFYSGEAPLVNSFSSYGGIPILFNTNGDLIAPDYLGRGVQFTGIDGSNNTFFRFDTVRDEDTNPNFFGTSAGAPNAAAIAVQMLEANPNLTPLQIRLNLQATAIDITGTNDVGGPDRNRNIELPVGFDNVSGAGLVQADEAVRLGIRSAGFICNGRFATVGVWNGVIYGGPLNGQPYQGVLEAGPGDVVVGTNVTDTIFANDPFVTVCGFGKDDIIYTNSFFSYVDGGDGVDQCVVAPRTRTDNCEFDVETSQ